MSDISANSIHSLNLTLCGCGWLGQFLVDALPEATITGTTRSQEKADALREKGVTPVLFALGDDPTSLIKQSADNAVILNIPPGRKKAVGDDFTRAMTALATDFLNAGARKLIFISTTSVFGNAEGELTVNAPVAPATDSGKVHCDIERFLLAGQDPRVHVVRLAGLVGGSRHPAKFLAGKTLDKGEQAVNLVHVSDVVKALICILKEDDSTSTFPPLMQLCSLVHPRRDDYYRWAAEALTLPAPQFSAEHNNAADGKKILSKDCWEALGLTPEYASPFDML